MIRGVGFDLGETLVEYPGVPLNWQQEYPGALAAVASACSGKASSEDVRAGAAVLERFNTRLNPREREVDYRAVFKEVLSAMDLSTERTPLVVETAADAFFGHFRRSVRPVESAIATVEELVGRGLVVGVLTDVPYGMPRRHALADLEITGLGLLMGSALTSADVGFRKPHAQGFLSLASLLGCGCDEMVFVGNEQKDVVGARSAGMHAVLLWRGEGDPPDWGQQETIAGLEAVLELSGAGTV